MSELRYIEMAGLSIRLHQPRKALEELEAVYRALHERQEAFKADRRNPHLCRPGCSHCCRSGAVFSVTLVEAVRWSLAVGVLPDGWRGQVRRLAASLLQKQHEVFGEVDGPADVPGEREESLFSRRLSALNARHPACPLLLDDLCSVYEDRPMLCRAYGFPVDAYAVHESKAIVFRSLCVLYEGYELSDYVRASELKERLEELSRLLADGRDWGRFTSPEAILAHAG